VFHHQLEDSWKKLHGRLGENLMLNPDSFGTFENILDVPAGWGEPPAVLHNAIRSFHVRSVHDDEQTLLLAISKMRPQRLELNPHFFAYGGSYIYALAAWLGAGALVGAMPLHRSMLPYLNDPAKMGAMYAWGRLLSVAAYIGFALVLMELGREVSGWTAGVGAAFLFILSPASIIQAHTMKPHMYWSFFSIATLYLSVKAHGEGTRRSFLKAGAASGLAVGAAFNAWPSCLFVAAASCLRMGERKRNFKKEALLLIQAGAASLAVFCMTNPYWLFDFKRAYGEFAVISEFAALNVLNPLTLAWGPLRQSVTLPLLLLMAAGLIYAVRAGTKRPGLFLCAAALILCWGAAASTAGVSGIRQIRYFLPLVGIGLLSAAVVVSEAARRGPWFRKAALALSCLVFISLGAEGMLYALNFKRTAGEYSNHHLAGAWIDANVPVGSTVGLLREPAPSNSPYFGFYRVRLRLIPPAAFAELSGDRLPEYFIVTSPDYDDRPGLEPALSKYYRLSARFERMSLGWASVHPTATTANPLIEIYQKAEALPGNP
jgi:hypothetical protein